MKYSGEVKTGITGLITIIVIIWGINYLKGKNILSRTYQLTAQYERVDGLEPSAEVVLDGYKIGTVDEVIFEMDRKPPFTVRIEIGNDYPIGKGSIAEIYSADLLGSKGVRIIRSGNPGQVVDGDTLSSRITGDMISGLLNEVSPLLTSLNQTVITLDSTGNALNRILNDPAISSMITNLENASGSLDRQLSGSGDLGKSLASLKDVLGNIKAQNESIRTIIGNFESISGKLDNAPLDSLIINMDEISGNLAVITASIEQADGTAGKLIMEDSLYTYIAVLINDLDSLVQDVNKNPKKYVNFSLIGR